MIVAFLGYNKPNSRYNGVATVILQQTQWLEEHGHTVLHYHLFSKEEYRNLASFLIDNKVDIAVWHMTSFKVYLKSKLPCPLICLYHSNPNIFDSEYYTKFITKYHIPRLIKKVVATKLLGRVLNLIHFLYYQLFFVYITSKADRMVLLSNNYISDFFAAKLFPSRVISISNACDMPFVENTVERSKNVVFLGRLHNEHKGCDMLLRIWSKVEKEFTDWRLLICGDGPDKDALQRQARSLGLKYINFQGFTSPNLAVEILQHASIFCLTSRIEGFGIVLIEAERSGAVPIAFDSYPVAKELIDNGVNGILVKPFDEDEYSKQLAKLMRDSALLNTMSIAGVEKSKCYTVDKIMTQWMTLYNDLLQKNI